MMKKKRGTVFLFLFLIASALSLSGCASVSTAPLPPTLNIVSPSPDLPPEIAAFSGVWEGQWVNMLDTILVVEKINTETAEIIYSTGEREMCCQAIYVYITARVIPGPAIEWTNKKGYRFVFKMNKDLNSIDAFIEDRSTGSKWWRAHLTRMKSKQQ
ncbi:MAG: hypothetical protein GXP46_11175 [Deferribacteres bacterium]|nr:hypothetical protein [Deferribacteres bacterium]